jgi:tetraprenyl-beta-curcumene synthase
VSLRVPSARRTSPCPASSTDNTLNPAPLSAGQLWALIAGAARELGWGLPAVARELRAWRSLARKIPDPRIRGDALNALERKRGHTDGAALFCILPHARSHALLRLLVAYEIAWDFLDTVNEHGAGAGQRNGRQLHLALADALEPARPPRDYYRYHPWREDGGYLRALVEVCRKGCTELASYEQVRALLAREACRAQVLGINHDLDPARRNDALRDWVRRECPDERDTSWFELTGAASASLTIHALLALAAEPARAAQDIERACHAYFPWISAATTMLDSYVDQIEDAANGDHSYVAHYPSPQFAAQRTAQLLRRSILAGRSLPRGERHTLIVAGMAAMYLSKDSARTPRLRETTRGLVDAGGSLTTVLHPLLRLWRIAYTQRST